MPLTLSSAVPQTHRLPEVNVHSNADPRPRRTRHNWSAERSTPWMTCFDSTRLPCRHTATLRKVVKWRQDRYGRRMTTSDGPIPITDASEIGDLVREARLQSGTSQAALARPRESGGSGSTSSSWARSLLRRSTWSCGCWPKRQTSMVLLHSDGAGSKDRHDQDEEWDRVGGNRHRRYCRSIARRGVCHDRRQSIAGGHERDRHRRRREPTQPSPEDEVSPALCHIGAVRAALGVNAVSSTPARLEGDRALA